MPERFSLDEARRIALASQGFGRPRPSRRIGLPEIRAVIRRLGLLQLDYVNVLTPAHYLALFSRLGPYNRNLLDTLVYRRREFTEQWAHEASIIPVETWPLLRHRMATHRVRPWGFEKTMERHAGYVEWVLEEVRARGPLEAASLAHPEGTSRRIVENNWHATVPRAVLEAYFGSGVLAIANRLDTFARQYDLAERVVPAEHLSDAVEAAEARRALIRIASHAYGIATTADLADYFRMFVRDARQPIAELAAAGELIETRVEGWREPVWLDPQAKPRLRAGIAALLSPFDPLVWFRPRLKRLFDFDYRFEIFVPAEKRRWGCYVLPFLMDERLVARVDLKADRLARQLRVVGCWKEKDVDPAAVAERLAAELHTLAGWLELDEVIVQRRGDFSRTLRSASGGLRGFA